MLFEVLLVCGAVSTPLLANAQSYSATYLPTNAPNQSEEGQLGTNQCGTGVNQTSLCQNAYLNSVDDFCLFAPPDPGAGSAIGNTERIEVSWCLQPGTGTRLIPNGAITGAHFVQTPDYVQITGTADLTMLNVPKGDGGGELDPHGADGNGNPIGGLVFSNAFGSLVQMHEWTEFIGSDMFCFRACKDGPKAPALCQHIYDEMGCFWNMPGNYNAGVFEKCKGDTGEPMGIYGSSTFFQGQPNTPPPHPAPSSSLCTTLSTIGNGFAVSGSTAIASSTTTAAPAVTSGSSAATTATSAGATASQSSASRRSALAPGWKLVGFGIGSTVVGGFVGASLVL